MTNPVAVQTTVPVVVGASYSEQTSSALIKTGDGFLCGVFVASGSSPTMKLYDNTAASGTVMINTTALNIGWNPCPLHFSQGLYATLGGTIDCTFSYV